MKAKSVDKNPLARINSLLRDQLEICVSCGTCRKACTVFPDLKRESGTPRGKLQLIRAFTEGEIGMTPSLKEALEQCTLCGICSESCPNHVDPEGIFSIARALVVKPSLIEKVASSLISKRAGLRLLALTGRIFTGLLPQVKDGWVKLPSFVPKMGGRIVPRLKKNSRKGVLRLQGENVQGERILFYPGCFIDFALQEQLHSAVRILKKVASEVLIPSLPCCGLPSLEMGDITPAYQQAVKIVEAFRKLKPDRVVVVCGSCGSTFKKIYPLLDSNFEDFARSVYDISEMLLAWIEGGTYSPVRLEKKHKVSVHHCCHLKRGMGVDHQVEKLVSMHPDLEFHPLERPDTCCGFGGIMYVKHPSLSDSIVKDKIRDVIKASPDFLLTGCPGCLLHIQGALLREKSPVIVLHPVQLF